MTVMKNNDWVVGNRKVRMEAPSEKLGEERQRQRLMETRTFEAWRVGWNGIDGRMHGERDGYANIQATPIQRSESSASTSREQKDRIHKGMHGTNLAVTPGHPIDGGQPVDGGNE